MELGAVINQKTLDALAREVGSSTIPVLVKSLCDEIKSGIRNFNTYFTNEDWRALEVEAHALKSATLSFGAEKISDTCRSIEYSIKENRPQDVTEQFIVDYRNCADETITALEVSSRKYQA
jgi:HPt (histidine-containing phosphotransfer) domain-containing protein